MSTTFFFKITVMYRLIIKIDRHNVILFYVVYMRKRKYNIDASGFSCQNEACTKYHQPNTGHICFAYMSSGKNCSTAYLKCTVCKKYFSENKGTFFYRRKKSKTTIIQALNNTVEGGGIRATARVFNLNKNTLLNWIKDAGKRCANLEKKI